MKNPDYQPQLRILSIILVLALLLFAVGTMALGNIAQSVTKQKTADQYQWDTRQISARIQTTLNSYSSVLYSGRAYILNSQSVEPAEWTGYFRNQDIFNRYAGMHSIAYVSLVPAANKAQFESKMRTYYGSTFAINPAGKRDVYAVTSLAVSTDATNPGGFDVFSSADRRAVYQAAETTGVPTASNQLKLASGQTGMFVTIPLVREGITQGYVLISLHSKDFFDSAMAPSIPSNFALKVSDVSDAKQPTKLFAAGGWVSGGHNLYRTDTINFGGRTWKIEYQAAENYGQSLIVTLLRPMILVMGFLFICVVALCFYVFARTRPVNRPHRSGAGMPPTTKEE